MKAELVYKNRFNQVLSAQEKSFLVPGGEFMPYLMQGELYLTAQGATVREFEKSVALKKADHLETPVTVDGVSYGGLMCSGIVSPELYRRLANQGANVLINSTSLSAFTDKSLFHEQAQQILRFDAMANAKPFIQSAIGSRSYIIDSNGNFLKIAMPGKFAVVYDKITPSSTKTPYTRFGELVVPLSIIFLLWVLVRRFRLSK